MINDFIKKLIIKNFRFTPTESQNIAIETFSQFINSSDDNSILLLRGYAGTGKTSLINSFVTALAEFNTKTFLLAPTGRAAKVLSGYCNMPAFTIHKIIYRQRNLQEDISGFEINFNPNYQTIFIVDEASMISDSGNPGNNFGSGRLLSDLISFVYNNKKNRLIIVGDTAQLPPISLNESPALSKNYIEKNFFKKVYFSELKDVVRQKEESDILINATKLRQDIDSEPLPIPKFSINSSNDIEAISGNSIIEYIENSYNRVGQEETIIITKSNKVANIYNKGIRQRILWYEEEISCGDLIMIVKNNYFWNKDIDDLPFIANGDIAKVISIKRYHELYDRRFVSIRICLIDYDIELDVIALLETLTSETPSLSSEENKKFYEKVSEDFADIKNKKKKFELIKSNEFFNALQIKFAYAVTCHKAQGGQWKHVYIDHGYIPEIVPSKEMYRWFYTAITRPKEKLYFVNIKKEFLEEVK